MDLDPDFAAMLAQAKGAPRTLSGKPAGAVAPAGSASDPSLGGGTLQVGPFNTHIPLSQGLNRVLAGAGQGLTDITQRAGNLLGLVPNATLARSKAIDAPLLATTGGKVGNFLGTTAALAPLGMGAGAGLARLGGLGARLAANSLASGAAQGVLQGFLTADPGQRAQGALVGGVAGTLLPGLGGAVGKVARGLTRTPAAQTLIDAGIFPTVGQLNPTGFANRMEQAAEGTLGLGDLLQNAREAPMRQYTRAMVERSMAPGAKLSGKTQDFNQMVDEAAKSFDTAYDAAKGYPVGPKVMTTTGADIPLAIALKATASRARPGITSQEQASVGRNLQDLLNQTVQDAKQRGGMQSDDLLKFRSTIRDLARGEDRTDNASRARAALYGDAEKQVTSALESQIPADAAKAVRDADAQYAKFAVIRDAAKATKDAPGGPTPFQISTAIAKNTPPNTYARGGGLNRDLSKAARETFQSNVPRTGLAGVGRLALPAMAALAAKGTALAHPLVAAAGLAPVAGTAALTLTPWGRIAAAGATGGQKALARGLDRLAGSIPPNVARLPGLYGRSAIMGLLAPRLQQSQAEP